MKDVSMTITYGADEAGRGPILGPMVIAVVALDRGAASSLRRRGVMDSKAYGNGAEARTRRAELAAVIAEKAIGVRVRVVVVEVVDEHTFRGELNVLEQKVVQELLVEIGAGTDARIVCDGARMFAPLRESFPRLRAVDRAESVHVSVAAASVIAKDERDRAFAAIARHYEPEFGPIAGGGYINAATRRFLAAYAERYGGLPPEARKSWGAPKLAPVTPL